MVSSSSFAAAAAIDAAFATSDEGDGFVLSGDGDEDEDATDE